MSTSPEETTLPDGVTEIYNDFFELAKIDDSIPATSLGKVVTIPSTASVRDAVNVLVENNILSSPVRDVTADSEDSWLSKYVGTIDAVSLMYWLLDKADGVPPESLHELLKADFATTPVTEVLSADPYSQRFIPFVPLDSGHNTMLDVMLLLGKYGLHRAYVVETAADISNVITQSSVVKFVSQHRDMLVATTNKTLAQLNLGTTAPVTVGRSDTFWTAFKLMREKGVSAVPVVDEDAGGSICGVVSSRDARLMVTRPTRMRFVSQPLALFDDLHISPFDHQTVCCTADSTLTDVIDKFLATQVHRVFVVDGDQKPVGVVSLRDVLTCLVKEPQDCRLAEYFTQKT